MSNNIDCIVCYETTNEYSRKKITCPYCQDVYCLKCFKSYLLSSINMDCLSCKKELNMEFISSNTPRIFHNNIYRKYRATIDFNKEKSLLPDTQYLAEQRREEEKIREKIKILRQEIMDLNLCKKRKNQEINELRWQLNQNKRTRKKKTFIKSCPVENCRGYLDTNWICGICNMKICKKCEVQLTRVFIEDEQKGEQEDEQEEHVCSDEILETIKFLKRDTRNCPGCGIRIYKIDGCDQMWCVECKTAFSWNTGQIEKGVIHNPHYYQHLRETNGFVPRNPGDNNCGALPHAVHIRTQIYDNGNINEDDFVHLSTITDIHRIVGHLNHKYPRNNIERINNNFEQEKENLRIIYLLGVIPEEYWKKELKRITKKQEKDSCIHFLMRALIDSCTDIFIMYLEDGKQIYIKFENLRKQINIELENISRRFNCKTGNINIFWDLDSKIFR